MDYQEIKKLKKRIKCKSFSELIALAPQNDPFYIGTKSKINLAQWFAELWERFGYTNGVHLRRMHYQILSQNPPIIFPNGTVYENTKTAWAELGLASKYARYLNLVDPTAFDDRRNGTPIINIAEPTEPYISIQDDFWIEDLELPPFPDIPSYQIQNYQADEKYHIEIWSEKSTMNDILIPFCQFNGINLLTAVGEFSITHVIWLIDRIRTYQKPCRIFYISDFDPAGLSMPVAVSRKIEKYLDEEDTGFNIRLYPLILTYDQCLKYELPRTPIKEGEKRAGSFEKRFGEGATELDALEALHPGELRKILTETVNRYRDRELTWKVEEVRSKLRDDLQTVHEDILDKYIDQIHELRNEYADLTNDFKDKAASMSERIENIYLAITEEMEQKRPNINEYPLPQGKDADELSNALFNSDRDYMNQIVAYKSFQGKDTKVNDIPTKEGR